MDEVGPRRVERVFGGSARPQDAREDEIMQGRLAANLFGESTPPVTIGRFEVIRRLGQGGGGAVYEAQDPELRRRVAIKVLTPTSGQTLTFGATTVAEGGPLSREARALAQLVHPNIVQVYEIGEHKGDQFVVMQLIEGQDASRWLDGSGARALIAARVGLVLDVGRALAAAHEAGIVHGDVKPANILIDAEQRGRLADFGIARTVTHGGRETLRAVVKGTPAYMAPEQHQGVPANIRTDVFSFCATAVHLCTGQLPYEGPTLHALLLAKQQIPRVVATLPRRVAAVLSAGLSYDPARRPGSMRQVVTELEATQRSSATTWAMVLGGIGIAATSATAAVLISTSGAPEPRSTAGAEPSPAVEAVESPEPASVADVEPERSPAPLPVDLNDVRVQPEPSSRPDSALLVTVDAKPSVSLGEQRLYVKARCPYDGEILVDHATLSSSSSRLSFAWGVKNHRTGRVSARLFGPMLPRTPEYCELTVHLGRSVDPTAPVVASYCYSAPHVSPGRCEPPVEPVLSEQREPMVVTSLGMESTLAVKRPALVAHVRVMAGRSFARDMEVVWKTTCLSQGVRRVDSRRLDLSAGPLGLEGGESFASAITAFAHESVPLTTITGPCEGSLLVSTPLELGDGHTEWQALAHRCWRDWSLTEGRCFEGLPRLPPKRIQDVNVHFTHFRIGWFAVSDDDYVVRVRTLAALSWPVLRGSSLTLNARCQVGTKIESARSELGRSQLDRLAIGEQVSLNDPNVYDTRFPVEPEWCEVEVGAGQRREGDRVTLGTWCRRGDHTTASACE
ncbi:MAG: protein kinase [Myxococcota bacterium]